ncbi:MAG: D-alanine--D-alanine ligase family protein [Anaerolineae bacterium]
MTKRLRVGIIFGGKSAEHEVSLNSAQNVMRALDKNKYEVVPIGINKEGRWLLRGDPLLALTGGQQSMPKLLESGYQIVDDLSTGREVIPGTQTAGLPDVDVIFPVLHGPFGEDGTVQGLLELADIPYVGAGVMSSAVGMDKAAMKDLFRSHGLPTPKYVVIKRREWETQSDRVRELIEREIGYPCFVKPANMGSSVGVHKTHDANELAAALNDAAQYDRKLLIERAVPHAREIECSVLGNDEPIASVPGEIVPGHEFYDYEAKYLDDSSQLLIPAPIDPALAERVRDLSIKAFVAVDGAGMARVDFLLAAETGELYLSELNTIPGFTRISMYPKLWEASGISYSELIDRLIQLALERHADKQRASTDYSH